MTYNGIEVEVVEQGTEVSIIRMGKEVLCIQTSELKETKTKKTKKDA